MRTTAALALIAFLSFSPLSSSLALAQSSFRATPLAEHVLLVIGPAGNTLVGIDADGLVLIDGVPAAQAQDYLAFVREQGGTAHIKALILSHWHPEVTGLNALLGAAGVPIIAHENTRLWLGSTIRRRGEEILHRPDPPEALPTQTTYDSGSLPFRGGVIEYGHLLQAHTDGDLYVRFPAQNLLYAGHVLRSDGWSPVDESTNGFIGGLTDAYDELAGLIDADSAVIPASGPVLDQAGFAAQQALYLGLKEDLATLLRQSLSAAEAVAVAAGPSAALRPEWGDPRQFLDQGFRSFYGHLRDARHVGTMP